MKRLRAEATGFVQLDQLPEALSFLDDVVELEALRHDQELPRLFWAIHAMPAKEKREAVAVYRIVSINFSRSR